MLIGKGRQQQKPRSDIMHYCRGWVLIRNPQSLDNNYYYGAGAHMRILSRTAHAHED